MSAPPARSGSLRVRTLVQQGGRVEVVSPQLKEGEAVEVDIRPAESSASTSENAGAKRPPSDLLAWIESRRPSIRTPEEWEQFERDFQRERDSWDR